MTKKKTEFTQEDLNSAYEQGVNDTKEKLKNFIDEDDEDFEEDEEIEDEEDFEDEEETDEE